MERLNMTHLYKGIFSLRKLHLAFKQTDMCCKIYAR
jgi:hypothetical protein